MVACKTCRPGTSAELLNCFYSACSGWSFILPADRQSSNSQLSAFLFFFSSLFFSSLILTLPLLPLYPYFPLFSYFFSPFLLTLISDFKSLSSSFPFSLFGSYLSQFSLAHISLLSFSLKQRLSLQTFNSLNNIFYFKKFSSTLPGLVSQKNLRFFSVAIFHSPFTN